MFYPNLSNTKMKLAYNIMGLQVDTIADIPPPQPTCCVEVINQEVDKQMFNDECSINCNLCATYPTKKLRVTGANAQVINATPVEATQRDYAVVRIAQIKDKHDAALRVQFNMDSQTPKTFLELEKLIKDGNYTVDDRAKSEEAVHYSIFYGVTFGKPMDKDGYKAAKDVLKDAAQKALDGATLKFVSDLEAVITDFEAWVYTPAT